MHRYFFTGAPVKFTGGPLNITGAPLYFTGAQVKYSGAAVIFTGPPVNFTGAPVFVMTLWQYRRTGITLIYHPIRSRLVSHSIQVNLVLCKRTMKSHHLY